MPLLLRCLQEVRAKRGEPDTFGVASMSKFIKTSGAFLSGAPLLMSRGMAAVPADYSALDILKEPNAVQLLPFNSSTDNLFAGHRSLSSHASHASHYSGAGGFSYVPPPVRTPQYPSPSVCRSPAARAQIEPSAPRHAEAPVLAGSSKLILQITGVQIALRSLKFFEVQIDGVTTAKTRARIECASVSCRPLCRRYRAFVVVGFRPIVDVATSQLVA